MNEPGEQIELINGLVQWSCSYHLLVLTYRDGKFYNLAPYAFKSYFKADLAGNFTPNCMPLPL